LPSSISFPLYPTGNKEKKKQNKADGQEEKNNNKKTVLKVCSEIV